jgi:hypothetical protein
MYFIREAIFIIYDEYKMKEWDDNSSMVDGCWCWDNFSADYRLSYDSFNNV